MDVFTNNHSYFEARQTAGDSVWFYTCLAPTGDYLNRFVDQPVWMGRSLMWLVYGNYLWNDYNVSTNLRVDQLQGDASIGVMACCTDESNYYLWRIGQYPTGQQVLQLFSKKDGTFTKLYERNVSGITGTWHTLSLEVNEGTISAYLDGTLIIETENSDHSHGYAGYRSTNSTYTIASLSCQKN